MRYLRPGLLRRIAHTIIRQILWMAGENLSRIPIRDRSPKEGACHAPLRFCVVVCPKLDLR